MNESKHVCMLPRVPQCALVPPTAGALTRTMRCRIRAAMVPCARHHGAAEFLRSRRRVWSERGRVRAPVCHPYSAAALCWEALHMALTLAALLYMPFQVFVHCPNPFDPFILFTDLMSSLNILITFATGYVDGDNKTIVLEPRDIARHYLRTAFLPDLIGALPLQIFEFFDDCRYPSNTIMLLFKLFRLMTFSKEWKHVLQQLGLSYVKKQMITILVEVVLFFHWITYIHYQVPCFTIHFIKSDENYKEWIAGFVEQEKMHSKLLQKYMVNLFIANGLCIGAGYYSTSDVDDYLVVSDLLLTSFIGLAGLVFLTYTLGKVLQLAIYKQYEKNIFNGRLVQLAEYMSYKRLPKYLQRKIQLFINYKFTGHYFNEDLIMNTINEQVRQDINMYGAKRLVMSVHIFQDMPIAVINAIIFRLKQVLYMPGQVLVKYGEPGSSLFMISSGTVAVMNARGRELAHLRDGSYFGETALLYPGTERPTTIIALEITEIYRLDHKGLQACLQPYPHLKRRMEDSFLKLRSRL